MGFDPITLATLGLGLSGVGIVMQYQSQKEASKQQKAANEAQARMSATEEQRKRIQATREARIRRAMIEGQTTAQGMGTGTSGYAGGTGSVASQFGSNIGHSNVMGDFAAQASAANQKAADAQSSASLWGMVGGFGQKMIVSTMPKGMSDTQAQAPIIDKSTPWKR